MKEIQLTQGKVALVDDEDYQALNKYKWQASSSTREAAYASRDTVIDGVRKKIFMHRQILGITDSKIVIDHKDHDGLNNQRSNLRPCTRRQNQKNMNAHKDSNSKYVGVGYRPNRGKFRARIWDGKKEICLGHFVKETDAAIAYNEAAIKIHGEFANLNKTNIAV